METAVRLPGWKLMALAHATTTPRTRSMNIYRTAYRDTFSGRSN